LKYFFRWSFFRAVSQMLCIGYGVSPPNCMIDMYVVTLLMLTGAICFALYIGFTTSILQSHNASKRLYSEKYSSIKQYMLFRKLPMELRRRISVMVNSLKLFETLFKIYLIFSQRVLGTNTITVCYRCKQDRNFTVSMRKKI
jgi:hypothetical protein